MAVHTYTPPAAVAEILVRHGWSQQPTLDEAEMAGLVFGGEVRAWSQRIVGFLNQTLPSTTGVAYLDDDSYIVGVGLTAGGWAGAQTEHVITGLDRADACFTLRAFDQGYTKVRPMPLAPVAIIDVLAPRPVTAAGEDDPAPTEEETPAAESSGSIDVPEGARVFVEVDPAKREVVYDVWAVAPSTSEGGLGVWRRHDGQWMDDPGFLTALRGETPPTLLYLPNDSPVLADVVAQVDESTAGQPFKAMTASITLSPEIYTDLMPLIARGTRGGLAKEAGVGKGGNVLESFGSGSVTLLPLTYSLPLANPATDSSVFQDEELVRVTAAAWASLEGSTDVLSQGDEFHVLGADAQRNAAEMVDGESTLNRSNQSAVDVPMYLYRPAIHTDQSVPTVVLVPGPQPASVSLFDPSHDPLKRVKFGFVREVALVPEAPVTGGAEATRIEGLVASAGGQYTRGTGAAFALVAGAAEPTSLDGLVAARSNAGHVVILRDEDLPQFTALVARGSRGGLADAAGVGKGSSAEVLRRYWAEGEGAAKIRWGVGGDWYRCVKHLRKYMGTRAKGYCNLVHKRALGYYPATHKKMIKGSGALTADGESWRWQLRDRLGQWMDMYSDVQWMDRGRLMRGYVVGSRDPGTALVQTANANLRVNLPTSRLTAIGPPPEPIETSEPAELPTPEIPHDLNTLSDEALEQLWWDAKDHPNVPLRTFLRIGMALLKRGVKVDQHAYPTAEVFASGAPGGRRVTS